MSMPIVLTGRMPYRLEYTQSMFKKHGFNNKDPYGILYSQPYVAEPMPSDDKKPLSTSYKIDRILKEYKFYSSLRRIPISQVNVNMAF